MAVVPYSERRLGAELAFGLDLPLSTGVSLFPQLFAGGGHRSRIYELELGLTMPYSDPSFPPVEETVELEVQGPYLSGALWLPAHLYLAPRVCWKLGSCASAATATRSARRRSQRWARSKAPAVPNDNRADYLQALLQRSMLHTESAEYPAHALSSGMLSVQLATGSPPAAPSTSDMHDR